MSARTLLVSPRFHFIVTHSLDDSRSYIGAADSFASVWFPNARVAHEFVHLFAVALPLTGIVFFPIVGATLDGLGLPSATLLVSVLSCAFGVADIIGVPTAHWVNIFIMGFYRAAVFGVLSTFVAINFGYASFGRAVSCRTVLLSCLFFSSLSLWRLPPSHLSFRFFRRSQSRVQWGSCFFLAGMANFAIGPLIADALRHKLFLYVNIVLTAIGGLLVVFPLYLFVEHARRTRLLRAEAEVVSRYGEALSASSDGDDETLSDDALPEPTPSMMILPATGSGSGGGGANVASSPAFAGAAAVASSSSPMHRQLHSSSLSSSMSARSMSSYRSLLATHVGSVRHRRSTSTDADAVAYSMPTPTTTPTRARQTTSFRTTSADAGEPATPPSRSTRAAPPRRTKSMAPRLSFDDKPNIQ